MMNILTIFLLTFSLVESFAFFNAGNRATTRNLQTISLFAKKELPRSKRTIPLSEWASDVGIKSGGVKVSSKSAGGLGLISTQDLKANDLLVQVPSDLALSVQSPKDSNDLIRREFFPNENAKAYESISWWAQLSLQINYLDKINSNKGEGNDKKDMRPWIESLPKTFDTPIHWEESHLDQLQYNHMKDAVTIQSKSWRLEYDTLVTNSGGVSSTLEQNIKFDDFVWGCENARSRAFSGTYSGSAFNPKPYAFTLFLVATYVGLNLGSIEQAANGAGLVFCANILKDFVLPKILKSKSRRYVICPYIDMSNHVGIGEKGNVAFEYFSDGYSLSMNDAGIVNKGNELFISYGARSNDQLLQYYGFVEEDNPHDVYVMPPLREWDIDALEKACGRVFNSGRLQKLEKAGLLGMSKDEMKLDSSEDENANRRGGVVISRSGGLDPAIMTALRALVSSEEEWEEAGEAVGNFFAENSGGNENERLARLAAKTALELELSSKSTTLEYDEQTLRKINSGRSDGLNNNDSKLALEFRIEKKKMLLETINKLL